MKNYLLLTVFVAGCMFTNQAQTPQQISLNGSWAFKTDLYKVGETENWFDPEMSIDGWDQMQVPGVWDTRNEYADFAGTAWYRKDFMVEEAWEDQWVRIVFQAVYNDVKVWLNGKYLGDHHVGFLPFHFDITEHLRFGEKNTIALSVDNIFKRGAIWNWGGIRQPVWLEVTEKVRLERQHIAAMPDLETGTATIAVSIKASNFSKEQATAACELHITKGGATVWSSPEQVALTIPPNKSIEKTISLNLTADQVELWHFNFPHLYQAELSLSQNGKTIHTLTDRFGIRKIEVDGLSLKLNGESIRPVGFNIVAEDRVTGNVLPLSRIKEDVDLLKQLGVNMARLNHLPLPDKYLDYLDEKGIMTFEEVSLWGKDIMVDPTHPLPKYWLSKMIETKYNHPSVIGWSVGNEIGYLNANPKAVEYVGGAIRRAKELDPTRLAVYITHSADNQKVDPVKFSDLIMLNKYGNWGVAADKAHALHPGKPIFYSEYGKELNHEDPNQSHITANNMINTFRNKAHVIGGSLWTFNDYRSFYQGSPSWSTPPSQNRSWGIVNVFRQKKKSWYAFRKEYAPVKALEISSADDPGAWTVRVVPRVKLDIPAYDLRGYRLLWTMRDENDQVLSGGFTEIPLLVPGDDPWSHSLNSIETAASLKVELLDPQSYSVLDTTIHFSVPRPAVIKHIHTSSNSTRVIFDPVPGATAYQLLYGQETPAHLSATTINDFIEVGGLEYGKEYQFALIALNSAGKSTPSEIRTARTDEDELPPVIWKTVAADEAFFIGYTVGKTDYMYEIQYGTKSGKYNHQIGLRNVGVCQIPNLENGTTYYYRLRRRMQWGFASEWSDERRVTVGNTVSSVPVPAHIIRQEDQVMVLFAPVEGATAYQLTIKNVTNEFYKVISITSAQSCHFLVKGLDTMQQYEFSLQTK